MSDDVVDQLRGVGAADQEAEEEFKINIKRRK